MNRELLKNLCLKDKIGNYGIPASAEDFDADKVRYLRITDISTDGNLLDSDKKSVSSPNIDKYILSEGDIVFARTGNSTGKTYYHEDKNGKLAYAGFLIKYSLDPKKVNPKYLRYFTISTEYLTWVSNLSLGSTRGNINAQTFCQCPILLPSRKQQDLLVSVLSALDSKIELNNRINAELESLAKTIYDYWFVQFDFPNADGKPYKSSGGEMVYVEEGKGDRAIPAGWEIGALYDLANIAGGSTPSTVNPLNFCKNGTAWITPKDLSLNMGNKFISKGELDVTEAGMKDASLRIFPKDTILLSSRAPIGYMAIARNDVTTNQGFKSFIPNKGFSTPFVYYAIKNSMQSIIQYASGSTFKEISLTSIKSIQVCLPDNIVVDLYTEKVKPIFRQQDILEKENQQLTQLRDWLLPMLMNGQVSIK
jgi:type I restriction enzyme S subunit